MLGFAIFIDKIANLENEDISSQESGGDYVEKEEMKHERWNNMLEEILDVLENQLSQDEMDELERSQDQWEDNLQSQADSNADQYEDDLDREFIRINTLAEQTKQRCSDLVNGYMR